MNAIEQIKIHPNPSTDLISLELLSSNKQIAAIEVFDLHGKLVLSKTDIVHQISINHLINGVCYLKTTATQGDTFVKKISKF